jgi:hypothetical protein
VRIALAGALCTGALLAGCGGESATPPPVPGTPSGLQLSARQSDCTDWNEATVDQRGATIDAIREFEGGPTTGGTGAVLADEDAYRLFENYCSQDFARAFKLYKLYARAAAFQSVPQQP